MCQIKPSGAPTFLVTLPVEQCQGAAERRAGDLDHASERAIELQDQGKSSSKSDWGIICEKGHSFVPQTCGKKTAPFPQLTA
jgi:hypothetical protein